MTTTTPTRPGAGPTPLCVATRPQGRAPVGSLVTTHRGRRPSPRSTPVTTRAQAPLPPQWAEPILDLLTRARAAAAPGGEDSAWAAAEAGQARIRTGHKAARRTASAGQIAAHLLRLAAVDRLDRGEADPATIALTQAGPAISSWDWDTRTRGCLDLRATFKDLPPADRTTATRQAHLVAAWLKHDAGEPLVIATVRLCEYVLEHTPLTDTRLAAAWYATHGPRLLAELTSRGTPTEGRPSRDAIEHHAQLRTAVRGIYTANTHTKVQLAAAAGTTRTTLDNWLRDTTPPTTGQ